MDRELEQIINIIGNALCSHEKYWRGIDNLTGAERNNFYEKAENIVRLSELDIKLRKNK